MSRAVESKEPTPSSCCGCDGVKAPGVSLISLTLECLWLWGSKSVRVGRRPPRWRLRFGLGAQKTRRSEVPRASFNVRQEPRTQKGTMIWTIVDLVEKKKKRKSRVSLQCKIQLERTTIFRMFHPFKSNVIYIILSKAKKKNCIEYNEK